MKFNGMFVLATTITTLFFSLNTYAGSKFEEFNCPASNQHQIDITKDGDQGNLSLQHRVGNRLPNSVKIKNTYDLTLDSTTESEWKLTELSSQLGRKTGLNIAYSGSRAAKNLKLRALQCKYISADSKVVVEIDIASKNYKNCKVVDNYFKCEI